LRAIAPPVVTSVFDRVAYRRHRQKLTRLSKFLAHEIKPLAK
jgi:hypothetical protein